MFGFSTGRVCLLLMSVGLCPVPAPVDAADRIRVALAETASRVTVSSAAGLRLTSPSGHRAAFSSRVTIVPNGKALHVNRARVQGDRVTLLAAKALTVTLDVPGLKRQRWMVNGTLSVIMRESRLLVVNVVDLEAYVAGVVSAEINPDWHDEVLKTQAVAARTYALRKMLENASRLFDVHASVQDQVYTGLTNVNDAVRDAVDDTRGEVITYDGRPIVAAYSSTAAGPTEDAMNVWAIDVPYLKGVECPFDQDAPRYQWRVAVPFDTIESRLRQGGYPMGSLATLTLAGMTNAGRVKAVRILHSQGEFMITGQEFRRLLGYSTVFSTRFHIERIGQDVVFAGRGAGHGVGLCQWGARTMAGLGYRYRAILRYYYPGTEILPRGQVLMRLPS